MSVNQITNTSAKIKYIFVLSGMIIGMTIMGLLTTNNIPIPDDWVPFSMAVIIFISYILLMCGSVLAFKIFSHTSKR